ncbi:glycosyl hydrolase [Mucilaginibacter sp. PAMB04168]|uniref:glycosyl hydrolase n=1 Tax=Mucilaginibacter sp. PAMB04168 TaxID=3138567 RepID=UPI0031F636C7
MKKLFSMLVACCCLAVACKKSAIPDNNEEVAGNGKTVATFTPPLNDLTKWKGMTWGGPWQKWGGGTDAGPYNAAGVASDIADLDDLGVDWVRLAFKVGQSYTATVDPKVDAALEAGASILMRYSKGAPEGDYGTEAQEILNENFLKATVERYKDRIKYWEIGNEPNQANSWDLGDRVGEGSTDPTTPYNVGVHKYILHLQRSYNAIKSVDPNAVVLLGGLSNYHFEAFMARLKAEGAYAYMDELNFHPYAGSPAGVISTLNEFKALQASWPSPHNQKPIWITEIGYNSNPNWSYTSNVPDEATKATYCTQTMYALVNNLNPIRPIFWYNLHESSCVNGFGLTQKCLSGSTLQVTKFDAYNAFKALSYTNLPGGTAATVPFTDDFNNQTTSNAPANWLVLNGVSTNAIIADIPSATNKSILLTDNSSSGTVSVKRSFNAQFNTLNIEYKFNENNTNKFNRYRVLCNGVVPIELATAYNSTSNQLSYVNASNTRVAVQPVSANTWYTVKLAINIVAQTFDIYVNGTLKVSAVPFKANAGYIDSFSVETGSSYTGISAYIDDLSITN